jgi:hypothetical protein
MNQTSAAGITTSNIISTFDIEKPEVRNKLFRSKGDQGLSAFRLLESLGYSRAIAQDSAISYEEDWIHPTFHSDGAVSAVAPSGNQDAPQVQAIVLNAISPNDDFLGFPAPPTGANYYYCPVQLQDVIMYPNRVTGVVTDIAGLGTNAVTITITAQDATVALPAVADQQELIIITNAYPEGSEHPDGIVNKPKMSTSYVQIIKTGYKWTGTQATNQTWFDTYKTAGDIPAYYLKGQMDTDYEHELKIDGALLFGNLTLSTIYDASSYDASAFEPVKTTEGIIPYMAANGNVKQYTPGTFAVQTLNDIAKILDKQFAPKYICGLIGINLNTEIDDTLKAYFQNTNINYVRQQMVQNVFGGDAGLEASVGFGVLEKSGYTFGFSRMPVFSHPRLYGASGYNGASLGAFIPMGTKRDLKSNTDVPYFGVIYKALGNYNRRAEVWTLSGAAPGMKVLSKDVNKLCLRSHIGAEHVGGNQMVLLDPQ